MAMPVRNVRFWALASLAVILLAPAAALACDTGSDTPAAAKSKKR